MGEGSGTYVVGAVAWSCIAHSSDFSRGAGTLYRRAVTLRAAAFFPPLLVYLFFVRCPILFSVFYVRCIILSVKLPVFFSVRGSILPLPNPQFLFIRCIILPVFLAAVTGRLVFALVFCKVLTPHCMGEHSGSRSNSSRWLEARCACLVSFCTWL